MPQARPGTGLVMDSRAGSASSSRLSAHCVRLRDPALNEPSPREPSVRAPSARELPSCEVSLDEQPSPESERGESGPDGSSPDRLLAGRGCPRCGFLGQGLSGRSRTHEGAAEPVLSRDSATLLNCKFATLNQLFGGDAVAGPNWCGVRRPFGDMVAAIASAESREAVAGGCWLGADSGAKTAEWDSGGGTC
jgi:hypothetical protein